MNKQQRDYAIKRINEISNKKHFKCECEVPSLTTHIRRAIAAGVSKVKPAKDIIAIFEQKIMSGESYRESTTEMKNLFEAPQSYKDAMAELKAEQDKHAAENNATTKFAQGIIDRIELGMFEDSIEPIRLMEAYEPKAPAKRK